MYRGCMSDKTEIVSLCAEMDSNCQKCKGNGCNDFDKSAFNSNSSETMRVYGLFNIIISILSLAHSSIAM